MDRFHVRNGSVKINVLADGPAGAGTPILCVHGFPAAVVGRVLTQPTTFITGTMDISRGQMRDFDPYADPGHACTDYRGTTLIPDVGHRVQQEAPAETNAALHAFVKGLDGRCRATRDR